MKRFFALLLASLILSAGAFATNNEWVCPACGREENIRRFCGTCGTEKPAACSLEDGAAAMQVQQGDIVLFGRYEQDGNPKNGPEGIRWIVLDVTEGYALLLSQYGLDAIPYHSAWQYTTWGKSSIFTWLNQDFLTASFSETERERIRPVQFDISGLSRKYLTSKDRKNADNSVFLLSEMDVNEYLQGGGRIRCRPTAYALEQGAYAVVQNKSLNGWWWLRTWNNTDETNEPLRHPGPRVVKTDGSLDYSGAKNDYVLIRPACWVAVSGV